MPSKPKASVLRTTKKNEATFAEVLQLIYASRNKALQAVSTVLIDLYWEVGATISRKIRAAEWGDGVVEQLATYIARASRVYAVSPGPTCSVCGRSTRLIKEIRKSHHWYDNCRGRITHYPRTVRDW
jgi:hypothetical protein